MRTSEIERSRYGADGGKTVLIGIQAREALPLRRTIAAQLRPHEYKLKEIYPKPSRHRSRS